MIRKGLKVKLRTQIAWLSRGRSEASTIVRLNVGDPRRTGTVGKGGKRLAGGIGSGLGNGRRRSVLGLGGVGFLGFLLILRSAAAGPAARRPSVKAAKSLRVVRWNTRHTPPASVVRGRAAAGR